MESPVAYPESPLDGDDVVYPCKGCGEILEEGKAFELAGNRWHINCFRCNTCNTLLDSDANLLLLGDGSLICNDCTYSCAVCSNKIEDLAILTGDQAFCSSCFRCRNCKRKIENLRYARTSQGIFCMSCHESLMARRRKKARAAPKAPSSNGPGMEKALPSLPPDATSPSSPRSAGASPPEIATDSRMSPEQRSPREPHTNLRADTFTAASPSVARNYSPLLDDSRNEGPLLPASTYSGSKPKSPKPLANEADSEEGFLPMAFDPTPVAPPSVSRKPTLSQREPSPPRQTENRPPRDYFTNSGGRLTAKQPARDGAREDQRSASSRSVSTERELDRHTPKASPHILSQDKGRAGSGRKRDASSPSTQTNGSATASPPVLSPLERLQRQAQPVTDIPLAKRQDDFHLQEAPKHKEAGSKGAAALVSPPSHEGSAAAAPPTDHVPKSPPSPVSVDSHNSGINPFDDPKRKDTAPGASPLPPKHQLPLRADSLNAAARPTKQPPHELAASHKRHPSTSSVPSITTFTDAKSTISRDTSQSKTTDTTATRSSIDALPPRSSSRPGASGKPPGVNDEFAAPRAPPAPPTLGHRNNESISTLHSEDRRSLDVQPSPAMRAGGLPKYTSEGALSMDDEMGRIFRGEKREGSGSGSGSDAAASSVLRRVSNAVKHGRNFNDRETNRTVKSPVNGAPVEISSPILISTPSVASPTPTNQSQESIDQVRASLRRAQVQIAELETDRLALQEKLNGSSEIKAVNTELREKRSTMAFLDSQREMVVRELEIMTEHLAKTKDSHTPLDLSSLKSGILKDFAESLQKLKDSMSQQIEDLMRKRNELTDEITTLIQMKDKGFQEYESLSNKNAQLQQHNNDLLRNIQGVYQDHRGSNGVGAPGANGLGIYSSGPKSDGLTAADMRNLQAASPDGAPHLMQEADAEPATVLTAPQVVNIRKGGKPTKFNWRKGGESLAKNVTKGLKGAFAADRMPPSRDGSIGIPYSATQQATAGSDINSTASTKVASDDGRSGNSAGFGIFGQKNGGLKTGGLTAHKDNSSGNVASSDGHALFGSELQARCDYENRLIPNIVARCIQEVEARGLDVEGIYRKSGGAGQVKSVQQGFEKDPEHSISDPDLEIHAVTSALKQYFRKLPTPLISYDVYDSLLEAGQMSGSRDQQVVALKLAVHELPDAHRDCLQFLVQHLARVMAHETRNLMTALNLAVVFAPTIMRPLSIEREMTDMQTQRAAVQALLENHRSVFPE